MTSVSLRRTKEMKTKDGVPLVALPKIDFFVVEVALESTQRAAYDLVSVHTSRRGSGAD